MPALPFADSRAYSPWTGRIPNKWVPLHVELACLRGRAGIELAARGESRATAGLVDSRRVVGWRSAFGAPSRRYLSSAHTRSLPRRFGPDDPASPRVVLAIEPRKCHVAEIASGSISEGNRKGQP